MTIKKRILALGLCLWGVGIVFPFAWAMGLNLGTDAWFNTWFAPWWMHVLMHAALYTVLALGLSLWLGKGRWAVVLLAVVGVGLLQEGVQVLAVGRLPGAGELIDLGNDLVGGVVGLLAAQALRGGAGRTGGTPSADHNYGES
jgi:type IV secretory pathway VirB2 component (pilin)